MKDSIFFDSSYETAGKLIYMYNEDFLNYVVAQFAYDNPNDTFEMIYILVKVLYDVSHLKIKDGKLKKFIKDNFLIDKKTIQLSEKQKSSIEKVKKLKESYFFNEWESEQYIIKKISDGLDTNTFNEEEILSFIYSLDKKKNNLDDMEAMSKYYNALLHKEFIYEKLSSLIKNIDPSYNDLTIDKIINNIIVKEILISNGVFFIKDLKKLNINELYYIFSCDYLNLLEVFEELSRNFVDEYKSKISKLFDSLKANRKEVLLYRNNYHDNEFLTLDEIGKKLGCTRERIRQIEASGLEMLKNNAHTIEKYIICIMNNLTKNTDKYVSADDLKTYVKDKDIYNYLLIILANCEMSIYFDEKLNVLIDTTTCSLMDVCQEIIDIFGDMISLSEYETLNSFEKSVVDNNYHLTQYGLYLRNKLGMQELYELVVEEYSPLSYHIGKNGDYDEMIKKFIERFGDKHELISERATSAAIDQSKRYCQINRGVYKHKKYCVQLPQELINEIINYILVNQPVVHYSSIYQKYIDDMNELGIDNYYYLKGLLDEHLPKEFNTKRNYINVGEEKISSYDAMVRYMKAFTGIFSIKDLQNKFPGVKEYTFLNMIYNEMNNGLLWLSDKKFIYYQNIHLEEDVISELKIFIDGVFEKMQTKTISANKIYARLSLTNRQLLNELKVIKDSFSLFSLIKYLYTNYYYSRPLISIDNLSKLDTITLITNHVKQFDTFNNKTVKNFVSKMNIGGLYSYAEFMEDMADEYVQINIDTMTRKELIDINNDKLKEIKQILDLIFTRCEDIKTTSFNGYAMFPKIGFHWNKYLLVGIMRTYFVNEYEVTNTDKFYNTTDYIIRRIKQ